MDQELKDTLGLILNKISNLEQGQNEIKQDVSVLKEDVSGLKQNVAVLTEDVSVLKEDVSGLKQNVAVLNQQVSNINLRLENVIEPKIQLIYENQINIVEQNKRFDNHEGRIEVLETDTFALKYAVNALK